MAGQSAEWLLALDAKLEELAYGKVVATAMLGPILKKRPENPQAFWWAGPLAWTLKEVIVLPTPVPCRGRQKLWELPEDVLERVVEGEAKALEAAGGLA